MTHEEYRDRCERAKKLCGNRYALEWFMRCKLLGMQYWNDREFERANRNSRNAKRRANAAMAIAGLSVVLWAANSIVLLWKRRGL